MVMRLTREAYGDLVKQNMAWLRDMPHTLERQHILEILGKAVDYEYDAGVESFRRRILADIRTYESEMGVDTAESFVANQIGNLVEVKPAAGPDPGERCALCGAFAGEGCLAPNDHDRLPAEDELRQGVGIALGHLKAAVVALEVKNPRAAASRIWMALGKVLHA